MNSSAGKYLRERSILALLPLFFLFLPADALKTKRITSTYIFNAPENMSIDEAKKIALERAKIQAIADEFGTFVLQTNSTLVTNDNGNSDTRFLSLGGSEVKGEWLEDKEAPKYELITDGGSISVRVTCLLYTSPSPRDS